MMQQHVTVHYLDGHSEPAVVTQYEIGQFDKWAARNGYAPSKAGRILMQEMPILFLRFGAWCALFRHVDKGKSAFETWDATVIEVENDEDQEPLDPTQPGTPDEPSPS